MMKDLSRPQGRPGPGERVNPADWLRVLIKSQPLLLRGMTPIIAAAIMAEANVLHIRHPREILRQGEPAACGYLILKGRIEVSFLDVNGNRVLAHLAGPGEVLGEVEQFSGCHGGADAGGDAGLRPGEDLLGGRHRNGLAEPADRLHPEGEGEEQFRPCDALALAHRQPR